MCADGSLVCSAQFYVLGLVSGHPTALGLVGCPWSNAPASSGGLGPTMVGVGAGHRGYGEAVWAPWAVVRGQHLGRCVNVIDDH